VNTFKPTDRSNYCAQIQLPQINH